MTRCRHGVELEPLPTSKPYICQGKAVEAMLPQTTLESALRHWRSQQATQENKPLGYVLNERSIRQLIDTMPASKAELGLVHGLGPYKLQQYGPHLLGLIQQYRNG